MRLFFKFTSFTFLFFILLSASNVSAKDDGKGHKHVDTSTVPRMTIEELKTKMKKESGNIIILDVRAGQSFTNVPQKIPGSFRIEPQEIYEQLRYLPRGKDIITYCT